MSKTGRAMLAVKEDTKKRFDECNVYRQQVDDFVNRLLDLWQATDPIERFVTLKHFEDLKGELNARDSSKP